MPLSSTPLHTMLRHDYDEPVGTQQVTVYTAGGEQIGIPIIGADGERLTFPGRLLVEDVLQFRPWSRFATEEELDDTPAGFIQLWWRPFKFTPKTLIHCDGSVARPEHPIGCKGCHVIALPQCYEPPPFEVPRCPNLDDIDTQPTPTTPPDASPR